MNPDYPFVKPRRHPNCLMLFVELRGGPCRRKRRAFFARMYAECRRLGLVMGQKLGLCLFFGAERICTSAHRHQLVSWLIDQPEIARVDIGQLAHLGDLLQPNLRMAGLGETPTAEERARVRAIVRRVAAGALLQWLQYLQGRLK